MAQSVSAVIKGLRQRFDALPSRDQQALLILGLVVVALLVYLLVWSPASSFRASSQADFTRQQGQLQYFRKTQAQVMARAATAGSPVSGQALLSQVSTSAQAAGIKPNRLQPEGSDGVSVWFDAVSFNALLQWLEQQARQGVTVRQVTIDRAETPGTVSARITLYQ